MSDETKDREKWILAVSNLHAIKGKRITRVEVHPKLLSLRFEDDTGIDVNMQAIDDVIPWALAERYKCDDEPPP